MDSSLSYYWKCNAPYTPVMDVKEVSCDPTFCCHRTEAKNLDIPPRCPYSAIKRSV